MPEVSPMVLALGLGALADCPWLALRKTLTRRGALVVLAAQVVVPSLLAVWVSMQARHHWALVFLANLLVVGLNLVLSHLREHLPRD